MTIESVVKNVVAINHPAVAKVDYVAIAEAYFQKKCLPDEVVHHIDGNRENNAAENLVIMKRSQHSRLHSGLMGALDKWIEKVSNPLCNTCLFMRLFEDYKIKTRDSISEDMSSFMLSIWIGSDTKPVAREILISLHETGLAWKHEYQHDCYSGKNMSVVNGGAK